MNPNLKAFLDTVAYAEGTKDIGNDGYNLLVGSKPSQPLLFGSYQEHPHVSINLRKDLASTAAGRYQIIWTTWQDLKAKLGAKTFSPEWQDQGALYLIAQEKATEDVVAGRFASAVVKCANIWASLPGAGYGQRELKMAVLKEVFVKCGGVVKED